VFIVLPQVNVVLVPGLGGYRDFFEDGPNWVAATINSLRIMLFSTTTAVILGFAYAYAMVYSRMPWKPFFRVLAVLPMLSPPFVVAASYILLFGPRGIITNVFGQSPNILGFYGPVGRPDDRLLPYALSPSPILARPTRASSKPRATWAPTL
jgi:iron(III) transport system permease protein